MDTLMSLQMSDPIAQHLGSWSQEINVLSICLENRPCRFPDLRYRL